MRARLAGSRRPSGNATSQALPAGAALGPGELRGGALSAGILAIGGSEDCPGGALDLAAWAAREAATSARPMPSIVLRAGRVP
jgi:hypothetical protein